MPSAVRSNFGNFWLFIESSPPYYNHMLLVPYLLLLLYYLVSGYGVLTLFRLRLKTAYMISLSILLGVAVASLIPFFMQLLFIPLTPASVFDLLILAALALNIPGIRRIRREGFTAFRRSFAV